MGIGPCLPCPFCGEENLIVAHSVAQEPMSWIKCTTCAATGPVTRYGDGAIMYWNDRRAQASTMPSSQKTRKTGGPGRPSA